jgi:hypothetical protein
MDAYSTGRADLSYSDQPPVLITASSGSALQRAAQTVHETPPAGAAGGRTDLTGFTPVPASPKEEGLPKEP